jgi:hypothetical protein
VCAGAAVDEDAVGVECGGQHPRTVSSRRAVEECDGKGRAISAGGRDRCPRERGEEPVQLAPGHRCGLMQQFVEQVVCLLRAERPFPHARRGSGKGEVGSAR